MDLKNKFISSLHLLVAPEGFSFEIISKSHSRMIVKWRNDSENLQFFDAKEVITLESQNRFIDNYSLFDRVDFVLLNDNEAIGVFSLKNLSTKPEYGSLIGNVKFRGTGIGSKVKDALIDFWFNTLEQTDIYFTNSIQNISVYKSNLKRGLQIVERRDDKVVFRLQKYKE